MRKVIKYFALLLVLSIFVGNASMMVSAAEVEGSNNNSVLSSGISTLSAWQKGVVIGEGVRLRAEPNTNSTIYGLMYYGEEVLINDEESTMTFFYVQRVATGEYGYVSRAYVLYDLGVTVINN